MAGPRWVKVDTTYLRNPKITGVSAPAVLLHLGSILWTADQLYDGAVPARTLGELVHSARINGRSLRDRAVDELVAAGLWVPNGDGWYLHDFAVMNPQALRAHVEKQRARWREEKGR